MDDFILITVAKYGNTQISRYTSPDLVEQAWQIARQEKPNGMTLNLAQYRIDANGKLSSMRCIFPGDHRKARSFFRRVAAIRKGFRAAV